jgi:hypothetical protein
MMVLQPPRHCSQALPVYVHAQKSSGWCEIRPHLYALAGQGAVVRHEVAEALGIAETTLTRLLASTSVGPGKAVVARAEAWLKARAAGQAAPVADIAEASTRHAVPKSNGVQPVQLSPEQCDHLALHMQHDLAGLRSTGIARDVIEQAVAGQPIEHRVVRQLARFLAPEAS